MGKGKTRDLDFFNIDIRCHAFRDAQTLKNILSLKNGAVLLTAL